VTVVSYGRGLILCLDAARALEDEGIDAEVIDLRCLQPYDWDTIERSIASTGRVLFVNEDTEITNFGEHLIRRAVETCFDRLSVAPALHAGAHLPGVGLADTLENASVPTAASVTAAIRRVATLPAQRLDAAAIVRKPALSTLLSQAPADYDFRDALACAYRHR
jgi:2-oxoisovalerate dehydrogenase E1 component beta subunit